MALSKSTVVSADEVLEISRPKFSPKLSRDEMNLAEFPLTVLSTRVNTEVKTLEFRDVVKMKNGELVEREWIITGADKFGLPTATDDDVILGLMCLTMEQGFRERKVYFSRYELLKILRWSTEGRSYSRLSKSLDRLSGVRVRASNAFFDNATKGFQTCNFGIIDAYEINDTKSGRGKSFFIWSEMMFDSFQSGFIKKLDLDFYFSLKSSVSRRLYRYLDKHFYYRSTVEKPLLVLAFEKLGLSRSYQYISSIKQQIEPAAEELVERGFLSSFEFTGRGATTVARFVQGSAIQAQLAVSQIRGENEQKAPAKITQINSAFERKKQLSARLQQHGLTSLQTNKLLSRKDDAQLEKVEETVTKFESVSKKKFSNPVGFLYRAVQDGEMFPVVSEEPTKVVAKQPSAASVVISNQQRMQEDKDRQKREKALNEIATASLFKLPSEEQRRLRADVEGKLSCLRSILDPIRFEEAVQGCMREELKKSTAVG